MLDTAHPRPFDPNPATAECQRTCYRTAHPSPIRAAAMESDYPGAAASLREGPDETHTVRRLDLPDSLARVLSSTNLIKNLFSRVREVSRRVKRWQGGTIILRWTAAGVLEAERRFRKALPKLVGRLRAHDAASDRQGGVDNREPK